MTPAQLAEEAARLAQQAGTLAEHAKAVAQTAATYGPVVEPFIFLLAIFLMAASSATTSCGT